MNVLLEFDHILNKMAESLGAKVGPLHTRPPRPDEFGMTPEISDVQSVAQEMSNCSHIVVLTGLSK